MNAPRKPLARIFDALSMLTIGIAGAAIVGMAAVEAWQVFARYVLNDAPSWTEPVALLLMSTAMMFGAAAGVRSNRHFGFFILVDAARPGIRRLMQLLARLVAVGVGLMLAGWGAAMMIDAWGYSMAGAPLPQGLVFLPLSLGGALITAFAVEWILLPDRDPAAH
jgi:TRAP-type C4-dicarboxylate transport system permease small subunit